MADSFFIIALLARESGFYTRDMNKDEVRFIKSHPKEQTRWLKLKVILVTMSFASYVAAFAFYLMVIKK